MAYTFELLGVSPVLDFFNHQQTRSQRPHQSAVEYLGVYHCTLDAFIQSIETVPPDRGWRLDRAVDTVVLFWLSNVEAVRHWKQRLEDAGEQNLIVARLGDVRSLQAEFEQLFS
jgi:plasmid maintenance system antidote protein VapI